MDWDVVINNGRVIDPASGFDGIASVAVAGGKIAWLDQASSQGKITLDARGKVVAPGFIDIHMHEDTAEGAGETAGFETLQAMARMGVTTAVGGNCGYSAYPLGRYLAFLEQAGIPVNYAGFVGHITLREAVGLHNRYQAADPVQQAAIAKLLRQALEEGAVGLSFGFEYAPGVTTAEAAAAAAVVAEYPGRLLSAHFRFDAGRAVESIRELAYISRAAGVPMQMSHIGSCAGFPRVMEESLAAVAQARAEGVDIMADCYPYNAFSTAIGSAVFDPGCFETWGKDYSCLLVAEGEDSGRYCDAELFARLRREAPETRVIGFVMHDTEVTRALQHPLVMVGSDGSFRSGQGHPRGAGAFPRVLGRLVREQKALPLAEAIAKMTILPAERLGLAGKGRLTAGADADIVIFDPAVVADRADFTAPTAAPAGIEAVFVAGKPVVSGSSNTVGNAGNVIRKQK